MIGNLIVVDDGGGVWGPEPEPLPIEPPASGGGVSAPAPAPVPMPISLGTARDVGVIPEPEPPIYNPGPVSGPGGICNCLWGEPYIDPNGNCGCTNTMPTTEPGGSVPVEPQAPGPITFPAQIPATTPIKTAGPAEPVTTTGGGSNTGPAEPVTTTGGGVAPVDDGSIFGLSPLIVLGVAGAGLFALSYFGEDEKKKGR